MNGRNMMAVLVSLAVMVVGCNNADVSNSEAGSDVGNAVVPQTNERQQSKALNRLNWIAFDRDELKKHRQKHKTILIEFVADW